MGDVSVSYLLWEPDMPCGVPSRPRRLPSRFCPEAAVGGPPIDQPGVRLNGLPSMTVP